MHRSKSASIDQLIGDGEHSGRDGETKGLSRFEIDHEFVLIWRLDREGPRLIATQNAVHKVRSLTEFIWRSGYTQPAHRRLQNTDMERLSERDDYSSRR